MEPPHWAEGDQPKKKNMSLFHRGAQRKNKTIKKATTKALNIQCGQTANCPNIRVCKFQYINHCSASKPKEDVYSQVVYKKKRNKKK